jgi:hypothetical protein
MFISNIKITSFRSETVEVGPKSWTGRIVNPKSACEVLPFTGPRTVSVSGTVDATRIQLDDPITPLGISFDHPVFH